MNQYRCIVVECCGKCIHSAYRSPTEQFCNREKPHWALRLDQWADGISSCCTLPYQSERDTVLELLRLKYVEFLNHPCPELADKYDHCCDADWCGLCTLDEVLAELRQAGEQCGDNCKGECSGEVTGTPFCPQSERDTVLERLHIWFENYCEGNEDPDLWVAFLHAERTLRQQQGDPR